MASDLLRPGLKLIFCGYNPSLTSGRSGHHYAHPGNRFRRVIHASGITTSQYEPEEDELVLGPDIGFTRRIGETRRVGRVGAAALGRGSVGILALTPRAGAQLIALALNARRTHYRYRRRLPIHPVPDVRLNMALGHSSNLALAELDCRLG